MQPVTFTSALELQKFLADHEISTSQWTKDVDTLFQETQKNDCSIWENPENKSVIRRVRTSWITVVTRDAAGNRWKLKEEKQTFFDKDGIKTSERVRNNEFVAEKLSPTEDPLAGAKRGLQEELEITADDNDFTFDEETNSETPSQSYPSLRTMYNRFLFTYHCPTEIYLAHKDGFTEVEKRENGSEQITHFTWIK